MLDGLKMTYFLREPVDASLENNIMQHICGSYEIFDDFFMFTSRIFLGYYENILGITMTKGALFAPFNLNLPHFDLELFH